MAGTAVQSQSIAAYALQHHALLSANVEPQPTAKPPAGVGAESFVSFDKGATTFKSESHDEPALREPGASDKNLMQLIQQLLMMFFQQYKSDNALALQTTHTGTKLAGAMSESTRREGRNALAAGVGTGVTTMMLVGAGSYVSVKGNNRVLHSVKVNQEKRVNVEAAFTSAKRIEGTDHALLNAQREASVAALNVNHQVVTNKSAITLAKGDTLRHGSSAAGAMIDGVNRNASGAEQGLRRVDENESQVSSHIAQEAASKRSTSEEQLKQALSLLARITAMDAQAVESVARL